METSTQLALSSRSSFKTSRTLSSPVSVGVASSGWAWSNSRCLGDLFREFLSVVTDGQRESDQVTRLRGLVFHLPTANYHTLRYLTAHLNKVDQHSEENKVPRPLPLVTATLRPLIYSLSVYLSLSLSLSVSPWRWC